MKPVPWSTGLCSCCAAPGGAALCCKFPLPLPSCTWLGPAHPCLPTDLPARPDATHAPEWLLLAPAACCSVCTCDALLCRLCLLVPALRYSLKHGKDAPGKERAYSYCYYYYQGIMIRM